MDSNDQISPRTIYVIDDNVEVRKSIHFALASSGVTAWPFASPKDFLGTLDALKPAPILLDIRMPDIDGVQLLGMLRERAIDWPVIMMTAHGEIQIAVAAMKLGASDFIEKPFDLDDLEVMLEAAFLRLETVVSDTRRRQDAQEKLELLTPREMEVALQLTAGKTSKMIGIELGISPRTVEIHRGSILAKLGVTNVAGVVRLMLEAES